jgi:hypothetical protein|nr:MAG TPA: hypothetical protein [Caudoviricetes sp.]
MNYLEECKQNYLDYFPVDWIDKLSWIDSKESISSFRSGFSNINNFVNLIFVLLSKSALSGEYIHNENMSRIAKELKELTAHEYASPTSSVQNELKDKLYKEYETIDKEIRICLTHYNSLWSLVSDKIDNSDHDYIFNVFSVTGNLIDNRLLTGFVRFIIPLCKMDHMLSFAKNSISDLILLREDLKKELQKYNSGDVGLVYKALFDKCSFLLKKMLHVSGKSEYCFNFKSYSIKDEDIEIDTLSNLYKRFIFLHGQNDEGIDVCEWQNKCLVKKIRISEIVMLMKYYQKDGGTLNQINNLLVYFNKLYDRLYKKVLYKDFDRHALNTTKNYLYNCRLSYKIQQSQYKFEEFVSDMKEIDNLQIETGIRNFYPYRKAVSFLINDISNDFDSNTFYRGEGIIDKIYLLEGYIERLEKSIVWCKNQNFYPFQLMFNECSVLYKELSIRLFIPSSFTRPIEYKILSDEIMEYKSKIVFFRNKLELLKEKDDIERIKQEIAKSERKYIEILGVFTAVITFLFGTIDFFSTAKKSADIIYPSLAIGLILLLFSSSIYFLTIPRLDKLSDYLYHPRFWFFGITSLVYLIILFKTILY